VNSERKKKRVLLNTMSDKKSLFVFSTDKQPHDRKFYVFSVVSGLHALKS